MNILVTGGAGYIGSHFCKVAASQGYKPVVLDNLSMGHREFVKWGPFVEGDILDTQLVTTVLHDYRIEAVVHFAAKSLVEESVKQPQLYQRNNVEGTRSLLAAMLNAKVKKMVFSSSAATYGVPVENPITESCVQQPINPYGQSKLDCEKILLEAQASEKINLAILRYFNVIGQDDQNELFEKHDPETHLVPNIFLSLNTQKEFSLFGTDYPTPDGSCVRDYVDVVDLAKVHVYALKRIETKNLLISNVGTGSGKSVREVFSAFDKVFGRSPKLVEKARRAGDPPSLVADNQFLKTWCDYKFKTLEQSIASLKSRGA